MDQPLVQRYASVLANVGCNNFRKKNAAEEETSNVVAVIS